MTVNKLFLIFINTMAAEDDSGASFDGERLWNFVKYQQEVTKDQFVLDLFGIIQAQLDSNKVDELQLGDPKNIQIDFKIDEYYHIYDGRYAPGDLLLVVKRVGSKIQIFERTWVHANKPVLEMEAGEDDLMLTLIDPALRVGDIRSRDGILGKLGEYFGITRETGGDQTSI